MQENEKSSITEEEKQDSVPPKKIGFDSLVRVGPLLGAAIGFCTLLFTIHTFIHTFMIHDGEKENGGANLTNTPPKEHSFSSTLASKDSVKDEGGTVHDGAFQPGGECGSGFVSRENGEVITFPIGGFTNMKAGTVELCVTLKQKLVDKEDYFLFMVGDDFHAVILQISWNDKDDPKKPFHSVRLRVKARDITETKKNARVRSSKIDWQPEEHHHIAATWGEAGIYMYIDGKLDIAAQSQENSEKNVATGRENLDTPLVINNNHHDPELAVEPTNCVVSNLRIHNFQKSHEQVKESYEKLHPIAR